MLMDIRLMCNMYVDIRGEILEKPFPLMACLRETSIARTGIDFTLIANFDLIQCSCLQSCAEKHSEAVSRLKV